MTDTTAVAPGLGTTPQREWPKRFVSDPEQAIESFRPNSHGHKRVLGYLVDRIETSERAMSAFYARWTVSEKKIQAYIDLPDWEQVLQEMNDRAEPAKIVSLNIPYSYATISTIVTYLIQAFTANQPMFPVGSRRADSVEPARNMESILQYNSDHTRMIKQLFQFFRDGESYGVGILRVSWRKETKIRTRRSKKIAASDIGEPKIVWAAARERAVVYEGNKIESWDPFMFFPDPNVPMTDVNRKGEYVFWRSYVGMHQLLKDEFDGRFKWVNSGGDQLPSNFSRGAESARTLRAKGEPNPGAVRRSGGHVGRHPGQIDEGTIILVPKELGLSEKEIPERWLFTILNKKQIIGARPIEDDHDMHPVAVAEPYSLGYGFGHLGMADYLGPLQDAISWFLNSHIDNVRRVLNDIFVVDPTMVEMQDVMRPGPGKIIRLKKAAFGKDVRQAISQLNVHDVTQGHVKDAELMLNIGQRLSAATDNLQGQPKGGRQTATQVRIDTTGALARLQSQAKLYSTQGVVDMTEMMSLNTQQYLDEEFFHEVMGSNGKPDGTIITPDMLVGDFHFPVHDGTIPIDKMQMLDIWREIFVAVQGDPVLRQTYSLPNIFEFVAKLGGIVNLESFRINMVDDAELEQRVQLGNALAGNVSTGGNGIGDPGAAIASLLGNFQSSPQQGA